MNNCTDKMDVKFTFVVIGGGIAGISCVESLKFWSEGERILLITPSSIVKVAKSAVHITRNLIDLDVGETNVENLFKDKGIDIITDFVTGLNYNEKTITTKTLKISFKKLCICTGGQPNLVDETNPFVIGIRDTESVLEFQKRISNARKIIVIGNGGIASEIIHEVKGVEKIWVVKDEHITKTFLDPGASEFLMAGMGKNSDKGDSVIKRLKYEVNKKDGVETNAVASPALGPDWHSEFELNGVNENEGIKVEYGTFVESINLNKSGEWPVTVKLSNGNSYDADFVVSATGVIPNSRIFAEGNEGLRIAEDGGIIVNDKMETSLKDIFAAGDVCTSGWNEALHWHQMRLWGQARQMGMYAGKSMVASLKNEPICQDFCFEIFTHVTKLFGFKVILLGLFNGQKLGNEYEILLRVTKGKEYIKLILKDGRLQGAILIGETDLEEMCENLILNQLDLTPFGDDLLNPDIDIEDYFD